MSASLALAENDDCTSAVGGAQTTAVFSLAGFVIGSRSSADALDGRAAGS